MNAEAVGGMVNFGLMALAGLYVTLLGYRVIGTPPGQNAKVDAYRTKWGPLYRIAGPVLMVIGVALAVVRLAGSR